MVALIAIHGLGKLETARLLAADLNLTAGRLAVRRDDGRYHTVYLDELTCALAAGWMRERRRRWPRTANPHLLITRVTASDEKQPPVAHTVIEAIFAPLGLTPGQLRRDRTVQVVRNEPAHVISAQIEELFSESRSDDVLRLCRRCHSASSSLYQFRSSKPQRASAIRSCA
ncbi:MAG TPA: hypothetical protein VF933_17265 [Streptosporangiaceae bacterium]